MERFGNMKVTVKNTALMIGGAVNTGLVLFGASCAPPFPRQQPLTITIPQSAPVNCYVRSFGIDQAEYPSPYSQQGQFSVNASTPVMSGTVSTATVFSERGATLIGKL